jgi:hypothetical protein
MKARTLFCAMALAVMIGRPDSGASATPDEWMLDPEHVRVGDIFRVTMRLPAGVKEGTVTFQGRSVPGFETGGLLNAYLGVDLDVTPGDHTIEYAMGPTSGSVVIVIHDRTFARESLKVDSKYTELDAKTQARVSRETEELNAIWRDIGKQRLWTKGFNLPTAGELGSPFGLRRVFNDKPRSPHAGHDIKAPVGTPVHASNTGKVALAKDLFFTGNTVILDHGLGLFTLYAHLSQIDVKAGETVERAQRIGAVGATGRVTGPHLHWGVKLAGARVDPLMLPGMPR